MKIRAHQKGGTDGTFWIVHTHMIPMAYTQMFHYHLFVDAFFTQIKKTVVCLIALQIFTIHKNKKGEEEEDMICFHNAVWTEAALRRQLLHYRFVQNSII